MDCTEAEFKQGIIDKTYDFNDFYTKYREHYGKDGEKSKIFYYFLGKHTFGYGFEPFELSDEIMAKIKEYNIKYVEE
jgi:hypothetical protein